MHEERSLLFLGTYWVMVLATLAFSYFSLREVWQIREQTVLQVRVLERTVQMDVRMVSSKKSSAVKRPFLFAAVQLRLERLDTHAGVNYTEEKQLVNTDEFVTHEFLDEWALGKPIPAVERSGVLELNPENPWMAVLGLGLAAWMMGTFTWMIKPVIEGNSNDGMGIKLLALAVLPLGAMVFGIGASVVEGRQEKALQRAAVEGRRKEVSVPDLLTEFRGMGVKAGDDVKEHFGDGERTVQYCEFTWSGKTWRTKSCQPPEGQTVAGRLNPGDPRDVKWGREP